MPKRNHIKVFVLVFALLLFKDASIAQNNNSVVDKIVAIVGNSIILKSDLYNYKMQYESQGIDLGPNPLCAVFEESLYQKLLYNQALIDSIEISDDQVESVLDRRIRFFIQQIGSREKLEAYYGKTIAEIKDDFRDIVREQELSQSMESKITRNVRVTPSEVKNFYKSFSEDEIPIVESQIEMGQIVKIPPIPDEEIENVKRQLNEFRKRILEGESFSTLAIMYSDDPGSARQGGELGFLNRGELFHDFEAVVFNLRPGEVSEVFKTQAGYHIAQLIERRGEQVNVRHILLRPKVSPYEQRRTQNKLDSIRNIIINGEMTFAKAAEKFSDDPSRVNEGIMVNQHTGTTKFKTEHIERELFQIVDRLQPGEISRPTAMLTQDGKEAYRIIYLKSRTEPKKANLKDNYDFIQELALQKKKEEIINEWIEEKIETTYLNIDDQYKDCTFSHNWLKELIDQK